MRHLLHKFIVWYLRKCAGAFHVYDYGVIGRYVVLMNEQQYHNYSEIRNGNGYIYDCKFKR